MVEGTPVSKEFATIINTSGSPEDLEEKAKKLLDTTVKKLEDETKRIEFLTEELKKKNKNAV